MANISITEIQGYDSISSSRLTINDNFNIVSSAVNDLLSILNPDTFELTLSTGTVTTKNLTVSTNASITGTLTVNGSQTVSGDLTVTGKVKTNAIWLGSTGSQYIINESKTYDGTHFLSGLNLYGVTGGAGNTNINTKVTGTFDYMVIPKVADPSNLTTLQNPQVGSLAFSISGSSLWLCTSTSLTSGGTGTWRAI